ncbi:hypothetical protein RhiirA1_471874 [Rhizophagus irregularis]|uniref:DNA primase/nucleoside triphosphatase C-terminal domain-containing protein n=1 Tax=Rhizophagus irregularis TaxID=588596 RepID=A0A2N0R3F5_9GLOM|nr:hypothetical protein RhiirA1_471874 [Rhizophagus irregularis]
MDPILWHVKNIICNGDEKLNKYIWNWWAYLVQKPEKKPRTILVLKSTLQQCGKNIITDFIGDKVLGEHLHYAGSDLEKMLGRFNSVIQARKLIDVNKIAKLSSTSLYQHYLEWCGENGEKPLTNNILGQKFAQISIDKVRSRDNGVRVNQYILGRSKIVAKLHKSGLGDMEEFSDISQDDLPENETADIPIFNVPEIIPPKIILTHPEKNTPPLNTSKDKKADKKSDVTQDLFDYVTEQTEAPFASTDLEGTTSGTSETSKTPESPINKPKVGKPPESNESSNEVVNLSSKETNVKHDSPKPNEVSSAILLARQQREERLRKKAVELGENPDAFVTITEKDRFDSITFRDRMVTDSRMCAWAIELDDNSKEHMDMTIRERLIGEEIICCSLKEDEIISSWLDTDKKWKKTVSILQENGMLW